MKPLKDIENISLEELEAVSTDERIPVPEGFRDRIGENLTVLERIDGQTAGNESDTVAKKQSLRFVSAAAAAAIMLGAGLGIARWQNEPKDTFDDPYLAYAELEKAFTRMSGEIRKGVSMAQQSEEIIEKTASVFSANETCGK
jgi:hypothetical protein